MLIFLAAIWVNENSQSPQTEALGMNMCVAKEEEEEVGGRGRGGAEIIRLRGKWWADGEEEDAVQASGG